MNSGSFLHNLAANHPKITLIGMSGLGKSHWSKMLEHAGFKRFCCDNLIADRLLKVCNHMEGKIGCLGQWMGFPFEPGYKEKEKTYLAAESEVLNEIIAYLETSDAQEKVVIDTTGSAPYAGQAVMERLSALTFMVHLTASESAIQSMLARYIQSPRPVLWGHLYSQQASETEQEALARSYRTLLPYREKLYQKYSHHSVPYHLHRTD